MVTESQATPCSSNEKNSVSTAVRPVTTHNFIHFNISCKEISSSATPSTMSSISSVTVTANHAMLPQEKQHPLQRLHAEAFMVIPSDMPISILVLKEYEIHNSSLQMLFLVYPDR